MTNLMNTNSEMVHSTKRFFARCSWVLVVLMIVSVASVCAQQTTGSIVGTVADQTGAVVSAATARATNVDTGYSRVAPTNSYGQYRIDYLPVGKYTVEVESKGFQRVLQTNLTLSVDQTLTVDIALTVGAASQTVTVTEAPPMVNTTDATLGRTIESSEIIGLPLVNRNAYAELSLTPGIMANSAGATSSSAATPNFQVGLPSTDIQINGGLDAGNGTVAFYLDGGNNITGMRNYGNPAPNPDAIEEFRVDTSAYSAEYGQFSAAVVSVITKSGTNRLHGSLFEFNRNTDLNAYTWQIPAPTSKAPFQRNNFGGAVGGPIRKDKSFFFFSYAGLRQIQGTSVTGAVVPTANERLGDFTGDGLTSGPIYKPGSGKKVLENGANSGPGCSATEVSAGVTTSGYPTAGYCIAQADLDTTALNLTNVKNTIGVSIPLPSPTGALQTKTGGQQYSTIYNTPTDSDEYLAKYDESIGNKDHLGVTYFYINTTSTPSGAGGRGYEQAPRRSWPNAGWRGLRSEP